MTRWSTRHCSLEDMPWFSTRTEPNAVCFAHPGTGYVLSASSTQDRWPEVQATLAAVADSFQLV